MGDNSVEDEHMNEEEFFETVRELELRVLEL
jgi:hypothetical protein